MFWVSWPGRKRDVAWLAVEKGFLLTRIQKMEALVFGALFAFDGTAREGLRGRVRRVSLELGVVGVRVKRRFS